MISRFIGVSNKNVSQFNEKMTSLSGYNKNLMEKQRREEAHTITFSQITKKILEFLSSSLLVPEIQNTETVAPDYACLNT
jgi:hypothetical protein